MFYKISFTILGVFLGAALWAAEDEELIQKGRQLEWSKKFSEAQKFYKESLNKDIKDSTKRIFFNRCAMFEKNQEQKLNYLRQACLIVNADPSESYRTYQLLGYFFIRSEPEKALGYFLNFGKEEKVAPALVYNGYLEAGRIMEAKGDKAKALDFYRKSLAFGKKVSYKYDFSNAEKAVLRLEKE